jgi:hypothetical protein
LKSFFVSFSLSSFESALGTVTFKYLKFFAKYSSNKKRSSFMKKIVQKIIKIVYRAYIQISSNISKLPSKKPASSLGAAFNGCLGVLPPNNHAENTDSELSISQMIEYLI